MNMNKITDDDLDNYLTNLEDDLVDSSSDLYQQLQKDMSNLLTADSDVPADDIQSQVNKTLQQLKQSDSAANTQTPLSNNPPIDDSDLLSAANDPALDQMMKELQGMLETGDLDNLMGGLMDQIISKELLHEPMKDLSTKYPEWLEKNKSMLPIPEVERYTKQYTIVKEIVFIYDKTTEKDASSADSKRVLELMQDMQSCGNPPEEILQELAPGLELGADGVPNLANLGQECSIM